MNFSTDPSLHPLIKSSAKVIERGAINVKTFEIGAEHPRELRGMVQNLSELHFLRLKLLFRLLAIFNVDTGAVPSTYVALFVLKRIVAEQKAPIRTVVPKQPRFDLMWHPVDKSFSFFEEIPFTIIRMNKTNSRWGEQLIDVDTEILERYAISVEWVSIRLKYKDLCWREVENLPEFCFLSLKLLFRPLALFNIEINSYPIQHSSVAVPERFGATKE